MRCIICNDPVKDKSSKWWECLSLWPVTCSGKMWTWFHPGNTLSSQNNHPPKIRHGLFNVLNQILVYLFIVKIHWTSTLKKKCTQNIEEEKNTYI